MYLAKSKNDLLNLKNLSLEFLNLTRKTVDSEMYAIACFHAGIVHHALDEIEKSARFLEEALVIFELLGKDDHVMLACKNLAEVYKKLGKTEKAEAYQLRAEALMKRIGERGKEMISEIDALFKKSEKYSLDN